MFKKLASLFFCLTFLAPLADAHTHLDPNAQIKWTNPITTADTFIWHNRGERASRLLHKNGRALLHPRAGTFPDNPL